MLSTYKVKLENKDQMISEGFYVRGDGTVSMLYTTYYSFFFFISKTHIIARFPMAAKFLSLTL